MTYTIMRRVYTVGATVTVVATAVPEDHAAFAEIRTRDCDTPDHAATVLDAIAEALGSELSAHGHLVLPSR